jgi:hypothetical protein
MADADKTLKLLIEMGVIGREDAEAANKLLEETKQDVTELEKEMGVLTVTQADVEKATRKTSDAVEDEGKKVEEGGHHAGNARLQHMALHHAFTELDKICPGLGNTLNMVTRGMHSMGDGAEDAQGKIASLIDTVGPLIVVMLSIQLATKVWDDYEKKLEEIQKKQEELTKSTEAETGKMVAAITRLDEAMHPKKTEAGEDKLKLEKQKQGIEDYAKEQSAFYKHDEEAALAKAASPEEKTAIKEKFKKQEAALEDWKLAELARVTNEMAAAMQTRTEQIQKGNQAMASSPEERAAFAQAQGKDAKGQSLQMTLEAALYKQAGWDAATGDVTMIGRGAKSYLGMGGIESAEVEAARKALAEHQEEGNKKLKEIREKVEKQTEVGEGIAKEGSAIKTEGDKATHDATEGRKLHDIEYGRFQQRQQIDSGVRQVYAAENSHFQGGHAFDQTQAQTIVALQTLLEKSHQNSVEILNLIVTGVQKHESLERVIAQVEAQVANSRNNYGG